MDTGLLQSGHTGHLPGREHAVCVLGTRVHEIQEGAGHQAVCTGGRGTEQPDTDQSYKKRLIPPIPTSASTYMSYLQNYQSSNCEYAI